MQNADTVAFRPLQHSEFCILNYTQASVHQPPEKELSGGREFRAIVRHASQAADDVRVQDVHHEDFRWHIPLAAQAIRRGGLKPEAWIKRRMSDDHDKWTSGSSHPLDTGCHELTADA